MSACVLLTGGTGFVGINIAESLLAYGCKVIVCSKHPMLEAAQAALGSGVEWVCGDVLDKDRLLEVMKEYNVTHVVHAAAITPNVEREWADMSAVMEVNCMGTLRVMEATFQAGLKRFLYISSVAVYGDIAQKMQSVPEDAMVNPRITYEISKYAAERLVERFANLHGMEAVALRLGDVFGAWEYHSGVRDTMSAPFQAARCAIMGENAILPKAGKTGWIYGRDVGNAVCALLLAEKWSYFAYNCGGIWKWSVAEFCQRLQRYYPTFAYEIQPGCKGNVSFFSEADNGLFEMSRIEKDTGFVPQYDLEKAVEDYCEWLARYSQLVLTIPKRS